MIYLRQVIKANRRSHSNFEEYYKVIDVIEAQQDVNPDICIESCRALTEGICKSILLQLDNTKTKNNIDSDSFPKLFSDTMKKLDRVCLDLEGDFASRFSSIMSVVNEIRNKRGEISHGRSAPKFIYSSAGLARTVVQITDGMLAYILDHYFKIGVQDSQLYYEDDKLKSYNKWLDQSVSFPIKNIGFSEALFQFDYDSYEIRYWDEYLKYKDEHLEIKVAPEKAMLINEVMVLLSQIVEADQKSTKKEISTKDKDAGKVTSGEDIEKEVEIYQPFYDYSGEEFVLIKEFSKNNNLKLEELFRVLDDYIFSGKIPYRDDMARTLKEKPSIKNRVKILNYLVEETKLLIDVLEKINERKGV